MNKEQVFEILSGELHYQDTSQGHLDRILSVEEELLMIEYNVSLVRKQLEQNRGDEKCLEKLRIAAACAVRCFENHGCPPRQINRHNV